MKLLRSIGAVAAFLLVVSVGAAAAYHGPPEPSQVYLRIADGTAALEVSTGDQPAKTVIWNEGVTTFHITNTAGFKYISDDTCSRVSQTELVCSAQGATKASVSIHGSHVADDIDASRLTLDYTADLGEGNDRFLGGNAPPNPSDTFHHGKGAIIRGGAGDDTIVGGPGPDLIQGEVGNDTLSGGAGDDELWDDFRAVPGMLNDTLNGGAGNDDIFMMLGSDHADGGPGNDVFYTSLGLSKRHSVIRDSGGRDTLELALGFSLDLPFIPTCNKGWKVTGTKRHRVYRSSHGVLDVFGVEVMPCLRA